jgi:catechol-2,3-dioxygenase
MITGMNHAVLYVRDAGEQERFFSDVLDFTMVAADDAGRFAFMRAPRSTNHHDIAFFSIGQGAAESTAGRTTVGLYHLAWQVATIEDLAAVRERLVAAGALVGASDHGASKSLYAIDPDGLEFEVMYPVPSDEWGDDEHDTIIRPLDIDREIERFGGR